ncbi:MAG: right-handed parallel beta-helix repeat-containing protein [Bacteroidota bacterium]
MYEKRLINILLYSSFLLLPSMLLAQNAYYVAKDGSDTNSGSESQPFLSIGKAAELMQAGDICYIKAGIYRETLRPARHGTATAPITFTNYQEDEVLISATEVLTDWTTHSGKIYRASVDMSLEGQNMLYYNGQPMDLARWPNNQDHDPYTVEAVGVEGGSGKEMILSAIPNLDLTGAKVWYLGAHSGTSWTRPVTGMSTNRVQFTEVDVERWPFSVHSPAVFRNGNRGQSFFLDKLGLLDYELEWYYDDTQKVVYCQIPDGKNIDEVELEYAVREQSLFIDKNYIVVDGLQTFGGKVQLRGDHCILRNNTIRHGLQTLDELDNTNAQMSNGSVQVQGSNNLIERNTIEYGSHNGIFIQGWGGVQDNTIRQNIIRYFNTVGNHSSPIRCASTGTKIIHNTIYGTGRDGIFAPPPNCEIAYNDISSCMRINNDGGIFYVVGNDDEKNSTIHHNWFHDTYGPDYADGRSAGIYLDNRSKSYDVHHNVVWNIDWSGVQMNWDANNNDIFNNTFWNVDQAMGIWLNGYVQENNRVWNNYANVGGWEGQDFRANIIDASNPFMDVTKDDFRPKTNSALVDQGIVIAGITDGYVGNAPDVGAYESGSEFWVAGATELILTSTAETWLPNKHTALQVRIAPNPARDLAVMQLELTQASPLNWRIVDAKGRVVLGEQHTNTLAGEQFIRIDTSQLQKGLYFVWVQTQQGQVLKHLVVN